MPERWRPVLDWEDKYEVSDLGNVRSIDRKVGGRGKSVRALKGKVLSPRIRPDGTRAVNLWRDNTYEQKPVKRLVLEAFGSPRPSGCDAVNIDENPANNALSNLEWKPKAGLAFLQRHLGHTGD